jgi:hypothetical protein
MSAVLAYEACPIKRARRSKAEISAIKTAIADVLKADHPMTVRQVFYQLVVRNVIEKTEEQYQGTVIRLLTEMRMAGEIKFDWISDENRRRIGLRSFDNVSDALDDTAKYYRRNAMRESSAYIEIWSEKEALSGIIWDAASDYGVPVVVSKGMPSLTQLWQTACQITRASDAGKATSIYQFGDHDPSGVAISKTIKIRLKELCDKLDCPGFFFERVALTPKQITQFNLPTRLTKRAGNRHAKNFKGVAQSLMRFRPSSSGNWSANASSCTSVPSNWMPLTSRKPRSASNCACGPIKLVLRRAANEPSRPRPILHSHPRRLRAAVLESRAAL